VGIVSLEGAADGNDYATVTRLYGP